VTFLVFTAVKTEIAVF